MHSGRPRAGLRRVAGVVRIRAVRSASTPKLASREARGNAAESSDQRRGPYMVSNLGVERSTVPTGVSPDFHGRHCAVDSRDATRPVQVRSLTSPAMPAQCGGTKEQTSTGLSAATLPPCGRRSIRPPLTHPERTLPWAVWAWFVVAEAGQTADDNGGGRMSPASTSLCAAAVHNGIASRGLDQQGQARHGAWCGAVCGGSAGWPGSWTVPECHTLRCRTRPHDHRCTHTTVPGRDSRRRQNSRPLAPSGHATPVVSSARVVPNLGG